MDFEALTKAVKKAVKGLKAEDSSYRSGQVVAYDLEDQTVELTPRGTPVGEFDESGNFTKHHACYTPPYRNKTGFPMKRAVDIAADLDACQENAYFSEYD